MASDQDNEQERRPGTSRLEAKDGQIVKVPTMRGPSPADLDNWFTHHVPFGDQADRYVLIRAAAKAFAKEILAFTPPGPDQTTAIRTVREAMMWANAAIACGEPAPTP